MSSNLTKLLSSTFVATKLRDHGINPVAHDLLDNFEISKWEQSVTEALNGLPVENLGGKSPREYLDSVASKIKEVTPALTGQHADERAFVAALALVDREVRPEKYQAQKGM